jgi:hypothetical protein
MAVGMLMRLPGATPEMYDQVNREANINESNIPSGLVHHFAGKGEGEMVIFDVWQSRDDFDRFARETLAPALEKAAGGQAGQGPQPTFVELHNEFHA